MTFATVWQYLVLVLFVWQYSCYLCDSTCATCVTVLSTCVTVLVRLVWLPLWVALSWPADAVGLIRIHSLSAFRVAAQHLLDNSTSANHNGDSVKLNQAFIIQIQKLNWSKVFRCWMLSLNTLICNLNLEEHHLHHRSHRFNIKLCIEKDTLHFW